MTFNEFKLALQTPGQMARADLNSDLHGALFELAASQEVPISTLMNTVDAAVAPADRASVGYRAWRRAWAEASPNVAHAWQAHLIAQGLSKVVQRRWFTPQSELHHLTETTWRHSDAVKWGEAFQAWAEGTTRDEHLNVPVSTHSTILLWRLHHRTDLLKVACQACPGIDLNVPIQRFRSPKAGYLPNVPVDFEERCRAQEGQTLLSVGVERIRLQARDQDMWAQTVLDLLALGADPTVPAWNNTLNVAQALHVWAEAFAIPSARPVRWEDAIMVDVAHVGRKLVLELAAQRSMSTPEDVPVRRRRL